MKDTDSKSVMAIGEMLQKRTLDILVPLYENLENEVLSQALVNLITSLVFACASKFEYEDKNLIFSNIDNLFVKVREDIEGFIDEVVTG